MDEKINQEILDKLTNVCTCKAIPRSRIKNTIKEGAKTVEEINKVIGSGSGGCKGKRCSPKIEQLLNSRLASTNLIPIISHKINK